MNELSNSLIPIFYLKKAFFKPLIINLCMDELEKEVKLCRYLLGKYADIINEHERITIRDIKELVDGTDLSIQSIINDFKDPSYSFQEDYLSVLKKVFEYIQKEINFVDADLNVNYWFSPKEIIEAKVADDEDIAIFLCALMKGLWGFSCRSNYCRA